MQQDREVGGFGRVGALFRGEGGVVLHYILHRVNKCTSVFLQFGKSQPDVTAHALDLGHLVFLLGDIEEL